MSSTATRVIKNTGYLYAKMGITMFVSLYTTRLILNGLGASDFGIFNIVGGAIAMLGFLNAAMASATQRFMSYAEGEGNKEKQKYIFNISIVLHAAIAVIVSFALVGAGWFFFNGILTIPEDRVFAAEVVYASLIVSTMFTVMSVPYDAVLNAHENMRYYAIVGIIESFLKLGVAFACVYTSSDKLIVYGILMAAIPLVTLSIMLGYCHKHYEECILAPHRFYTNPLMKEMTSFAGWNFVGTASSILGNYGQAIVLNHFFGTILNAALGIANQLNGILLVFTNNMLKAVNPVITKSEGAGQRGQMISQATTACKFSFFMLAVFAIPAIIEMPYILRVWLKQVPDWAVVFSQFQLIRSLLEQLNIAYGSAINSEGSISSYNKAIALVNILPMVLVYALFKAGFSPIAMLIVNVCIWGGLFGIVRLYYMKKNCGMSIRCCTRDLLIPSLSPFAIAFGIALLPQILLSESFTRVLITIMVSTVAYIPLFYTLSMSQQERTFLKQIIIKWKQYISH